MVRLCMQCFCISSILLLSWGCATSPVKKTTPITKSQVIREGPRLSRHQVRQGDMFIETVWSNDKGMGSGDIIIPATMLIRVSQGAPGFQTGKFLHIMNFFKIDDNNKLSPEFTLYLDRTVPIGGDNPIKGVINFYDKETRKVTNSAVLLGDLKVTNEYIAYFTGSAIFANEQTVSQYASWNETITNVVIKGGNTLVLQPDNPIPIMNNLFE